MLAAESQRVIWLRSMKLAAGGAKAEREARLMMTEKMAAGSQEWLRLFMGASADSVVKGYRRRVKATHAAFEIGLRVNKPATIV